MSADCTEPESAGTPFAGLPACLVLPRATPDLSDLVQSAFEAGVPVVSPDAPESRRMLGMGGLVSPTAAGWAGLQEAAERLREPEVREAAIRKGYAQARRVQARRAPAPAAEVPLPEQARVTTKPEAREAAPPVELREWFMAIGGWGDTFAACGNLLSALAHHRADRTRALYFGFDPAIPQFLAAQPWIADVRHLLPSDRKDYDRIVKLACDSKLPWEKTASGLTHRAGLTPRDVAPTHVDRSLKDRPVIRRWWRAQLPGPARAWAAEFAERLPSRWHLLHPVSTHSTGLRHHWPHWAAAVKWLLAETPFTYVLTGTGWDSGSLPRSERLVDLVGKTATHLQTLALAEQSSGLITTSNSLSMWSVMQNLPAVVCCNNLSDAPDSYFYRWIDGGRNQLIARDADLERFALAANALFAEWS